MDSTSRDSPTDIAKHPTVTSNSSESSGAELSSSLHASLSSDDDDDNDLNMPQQQEQQEQHVQEEKKTNLSSRNTSGFTGVNKKGKKFTASIYIGGRTKYLGTFDTTKEAAIAYDLAAIGLKRPKSSLNFPDINYEPSLKSNHGKRKRWSMENSYASVPQHSYASVPQQQLLLNFSPALWQKEWQQRQQQQLELHEIGFDLSLIGLLSDLVNDL